MKYLVIKGWLGFGDRLESLKMGIKYALDHNLKIYVDWTDSMWSHGTESFYTYFKLVNISQLQSLDEIPEDATVYPTFWKGQLARPFDHNIQTTGLCLDVNIRAMTETYDADVLVLSNCGVRKLFSDNTFFANVFRVSDPRILSKVQKRNIDHSLATAIGIHIRGTDKFKNSTQKIAGVQYAAVNATMGGALNGKKLIVVSDDAESMNVWRNFFPRSILLSELAILQSSMKGNHNLAKEELKVSKDELNVELLVDFFTLSLTEQIIATNADSRFSKEARRLHPIVNRILGE